MGTPIGGPSQLILWLTYVNQTSITQAQCHLPPAATHWPLAFNPTELLLEESDAQVRARQRGQDFQGTVVQLTTPSEGEMTTECGEQSMGVD